MTQKVSSYPLNGFPTCWYLRGGEVPHSGVSVGSTAFHKYCDYEIAASAFGLLAMTAKSLKLSLRGAKRRSNLITL